jgi:hypothetical protein
MTASTAPAETPVYLLAEHLDATLAAIEDLRATTPSIAMPSPQRPGLPRPSLAGWVRRLERHEASALLRVERARALTEAAMAADSRLETLGKLFLAGTAALDEAVKSFTDRTGHAFQTGGDALAYLRQRGVLHAEAGTMSITEATRIGDDFRLAGIIEVEPLADLVATFLDTLDIHYDLFPPLAPDQPGPDHAAPVPSLT